MVALGGWLPDFWMRCSSKPWNSGKLRDMFEICWATNLNHQLTIAWYMRGVFPWLELFAPGTWISILSLILIVALMVHSPASYIRTTPGHVYTCEGVSRYHSHAMPKKKYGHCALSCWGSAWNRPSPTIALYDKDAYELCYVYPSKPLLPPCIGHDSGLDIYYKTFKDNLFQTYSSTFQEVPMLYLNSEGRWNMMGFGDLTPGRNPVFLCRHPLENSDVELSCVCWIRSRMQVSKTPRRIDGDNPKSSARSARLVFFWGAHLVDLLDSSIEYWNLHMMLIRIEVSRFQPWNLVWKMAHDIPTSALLAALAGGQRQYLGGFRCCRVQWVCDVLGGTYITLGYPTPFRK